MIELSANTALMLYLFLTLSILLGLWGYHHFQTRKKAPIIAEQELFVCEFCHFVYLQSFGKKLTQCPQCKSFNKQNNFK